MEDTMSKPKKIHPAEEADIAKIAQATHFTIHLRSGPHDKVTKTAKTLASAIKIADKLGKTPGGRKPMIYAVTPDKMTVHVPASMIAENRALAATGARQTKAASEGEKKPRRATGPASGRPMGRRAEITANAAKGILPPIPDFSAPTHARFRKKLAEIVAMVESKDVAGLRAIEIKTYSSSPKAIARYRDLAIAALLATQLP
jgi:hypothetical protein